MDEEGRSIEISTTTNNKYNSILCCTTALSRYKSAHTSILYTTPHRYNSTYITILYTNTTNTDITSLTLTYWAQIYAGTSPPTHVIIVCITSHKYNYPPPTHSTTVQRYLQPHYNPVQQLHTDITPSPTLTAILSTTLHWHKFTYHITTLYPTPHRRNTTHPHCIDTDSSTHIFILYLTLHRQKFHPSTLPYFTQFNTVITWSTLLYSTPLYTDIVPPTHITLFYTI